MTARLIVGLLLCLPFVGWAAEPTLETLHRQERSPIHIRVEGAPVPPVSVTIVRPAHSRTHQIILSYRFSQSLNVLNGPGGARDYVAIFRVADGKRLDWKYLDDKKDWQVKAKMTSGPTAGTVRFAGLASGNYAARFYRNGSTAQEDMLWSELFTVQPAELEYIFRESDTVNVERVKGASRDVVTVTHMDGRVEVLELDPSIILHVRKAREVQ